MMLQPTLEKLRELKLGGMLTALESIQASPEQQQLSLSDLLGLLVDAEVNYRHDKRLKRLLRQAKLRLPQACVEDIDYHTPRNLPKPQLQTLSSCNYISKHLGIIITGPSGVGKTYIACALGNQACRLGYSTKYLRTPRLLEQLRISKADGSYQRFLSQVAKTQLLILDDWGIGKLSSEQRHSLFEIIEDRYQQQATLIISQLPISGWHDFIGDDTIADAILDRLVHNAYKLELTGGSIRKQQGETALKGSDK